MCSSTGSSWNRGNSALRLRDRLFSDLCWLSSPHPLILLDFHLQMNPKSYSQTKSKSELNLV